MSRLRHHILIVFGASLWGLIAIFVKHLQSAGFNSMEITAIRAVSAFIFLFVIGIWKYRSHLALRIRHIHLFIGTGILSIVFFNWCYFTAIEEMSISLAVILLYTAPAFVAVLSVFFLREKMTRKKIVSIIGTIIGCILVSGLSFSEVSEVKLFGLLVGLGSGLGYALYTIFGKLSLAYYSSFAITFYTFLTASLFMIPTTRLWEKSDLLLRGDILLYGIGLGLIPTVLAYMLYTEGLEKVDGSIASILANFELIVALFLGVLMYNESLMLSQWLGALTILCSVIYVNWTKRKLTNKKSFFSV